MWKEIDDLLHANMDNFVLTQIAQGKGGYSVIGTTAAGRIIHFDTFKDLEGAKECRDKLEKIQEKGSKGGDKDYE